jgi:hypothetical protein
LECRRARRRQSRRSTRCLNRRSGQQFFDRQGRSPSSAISPASARQSRLLPGPRSEGSRARRRTSRRARRRAARCLDGGRGAALVGRAESQQGYVEPRPPILERIRMRPHIYLAWGAVGVHRNSPKDG